MLIENLNNGKIKITISDSIEKFGLQQAVNHIRHLEVISSSKIKQSNIDKLANEVNSSLWQTNKNRFLNKP